MAEQPIVDTDDFHVRFFLPRLADTADHIKWCEQKKRKAEQRRHDMIEEAIKIGFADRDIARAAKVKLHIVQEARSRYAKTRLGWAS